MVSVTQTWHLQTKIWAPGVFIATGMSLGLSPFSSQNKEIHICMLTHASHVWIYYCVSLSVYIIKNHTFILIPTIPIQCPRVLWLPLLWLYYCSAFLLLSFCLVFGFPLVALIKSVSDHPQWQGFPTSRSQTGTSLGLLGTGPHSRRWAWMQCIWIILKLSPDPQAVEKLSSTKPVPGTKKVEDRCSVKITVG